jgi:hypothetical protein
LIAEEGHPQFLSEDGAESILLRIAKENNLVSRHLFAYHDRTDRSRIGYRALGAIYQLLLGESTNPSMEIAQARGKKSKQRDQSAAA